MTSADRLLAAEKQFSELADQLQKLKSAAQAIEQAGHATGQMRALAESAIATATSLGEKIGHTTEVIERQNIPERLLENESRLTAKFLELKELESASISAAERDAQTQRDLLIEVRGSIAALENRFAQESERASKTFRHLLLLQVLLSALLAYLILKF
jgi:hypothetical protein